MFFLYRFIISWVIWIIFADKKRWRELLPVSIMAGYLSKLSDCVFIEFFMLWQYHEPHESGKVVELFTNLLDDISIYVVAVYLYIQKYPREKKLHLRLIYLMAWSLLSLSIEWLHILTKHMTHHHFWTLWHSFAADIFLFWLFEKLYTTFKFRRLR